MEQDKKQKINEYLLGVKMGDRASLTKLHCELSATIWHIAIKYLRSEQDADDLAQNFWSDIFDIAQGFIIPVNAYSYLCKIATRKAINRFHQLHRIENAKVSAVDYSLYKRDESDCTDDRDDFISLEMAISQLDDDEVIVIQSTYFEDKTIREVASELDTSKSNISKIKKKAIEKLRKILSIDMVDDGDD